MLGHLAERDGSACSHVLHLAHPTRASCLASRTASPCVARPDSRCAQPRSNLYTMASSSMPASSSASINVHLGAASRWTHVRFMRFRCMLHMFYLILQKWIWCCICCNNYTRMLQVYVSNVSAVLNICCKCFIWMLHMLQWLYTYVASVCFKCFSCFKRTLQVFLSRCCICCSAYTHTLQAYVVNISSVSYICCSKWFMLQMFHEQARQGGANEGGPRGAAVPAWA
jgi:hypothetical protein